MGAVYTSHYQLDALYIEDTIVNYQQITPASVSGLLAFTKTNANSKLYVGIRDTIDNIYSVLGSSSSASTFEAKLNAAFVSNSGR